MDGARTFEITVKNGWLATDGNGVRADEIVPACMDLPAPRRLYVDLDLLHLMNVNAESQ